LKFAATQPLSRNQPRGQPSATIYPCSKHIRTGRKADRYDSGLEAHSSNRPYPAVDGSHARPRHRASVRDRHSVTACGREHVRYDGRDRLIGIDENGSAVTTFQYDVLGRRISKRDENTHVETLYRYDGQNVIEEETGGVITTMLNGFGLDKRYSRSKPAIGDGGATGSSATLSNRGTYITDALGSTLALQDDSGNWQARYRYTPYGQTQAQAFNVNGTALPAGAAADAALPELNNPYQYTGRENDGNGLYYYRARYYNPTQGRFTQEDPLGFVDGPNPYAYVGGNPLQYSDPLGLWRWGDSLPQWMVDGAAGFGDGMTGGTTGLFREATGWGSASVNKCASTYRYSGWAGIAFGTWVPIGRAAYVYNVSRLPRSGLPVGDIVATRNALKAYFRGRPLSYLLPKLRPRYGYPTLAELLETKTIEQVIARSGGSSMPWSIVLIGGGSLKTLYSAFQATNAECDCGGQ